MADNGVFSEVIEYGVQTNTNTISYGGYGITAPQLPLFTQFYKISVEYFSGSQTIKEPSVSEICVIVPSGGIWWNAPFLSLQQNLQLVRNITNQNFHIHRFSMDDKKLADFGLLLTRDNKIKYRGNIKPLRVHVTKPSGNYGIVHSHFYATPIKYTDLYGNGQKFLGFVNNKPVTMSSTKNINVIASVNGNKVLYNLQTKKQESIHTQFGNYSGRLYQPRLDEWTWNTNSYGILFAEV